MYRLRLVFMLTIASLAAVAQSKNGEIVIGKTDSLYSTILKENRKIWVYVPNQGSMDPGRLNQRFPVVYLLDGDGHFHSVTGLIQQLSQVNGNTNVPEMIVVGIPNTDRFRDLTPTFTDRMPFPGKPPGSAGGGEAFTAFIEKELMPHIDSLYPTAPYKIMIGHSLGGLMVVNTLIHHPKLFNGYIAIDPSLWWHDQKLLKESATALRTNDYAGRSLYLGIANTLPAKMDTVKMKKDTSSAAIHPRSIFAFRDLLRKGPVNGLRWSSRYYPDDTHGSVPLITAYDGLRFIFNVYKSDLMNRFEDSTFDFTSALTAYYKKISVSMGYEVKPPEGIVNSLGYGMIEQKRFDQARRLFVLNTESYPTSANTFDSLGDLYVATNDKAKAMEAYEKALALFENSVTREKLEKLKK